MSFTNEPVLELRRASARATLEDALADLDARLPLEVPVLLGDGRRADHELVSTDPGRPDRVVAHTASSTTAEVDEAVRRAAGPGSAWGRTPTAERAAVLRRAAAGMRRDRPRLAALAVRECAKPWREADADVCEAIDFLEYYAAGAEAMAATPARPELLQPTGERNELRFVPRGVTAVISPWNFPLAIACGMTAASLATGNATVLKPAEQSPACAHEVVRALREAGVPADALALLPGEGDVGAHLAAHPDVATVAFTGSGAVGQELLRTCAEIRPGQRHLKRLVAEMGGKNCLLVDADADLDQVVPGLLYSAFGFAGQKCSATSRVLAHEAVLPALLERLAGALPLLVVDRADRFGVDVAPVIDDDAVRRIERYRDLAARTGRLLDGPEPLGTDGNVVLPGVACDVPQDSALLREEVFGPLVSVESVATIDEACDRVDDLPFGLTGGLYSRDPRTVAHVVGRTRVGNFYVNRETTGAMVGRQPFGGNRLSGTGTKAGGPDYLRHFVDPVAISEDTMRHGLPA